MSPEQSIADLDRELAEHGQTVILKRPRDGSTATLSLRAFVRGYKPSELVGTLKQGDSTAILSPTGLAAWPDDVKKGDWIEVAGKLRSIEMPDPLYLNDELVRVNLLVR